MHDYSMYNACGKDAISRRDIGARPRPSLKESVRAAGPKGSRRTRAEGTPEGLLNARPPTRDLWMYWTCGLVVCAVPAWGILVTSHMPAACMMDVGM